MGLALSEDELRDRFRALRTSEEDASTKLRHELITEFTGLAAYFARRYDRRGVPREDLHQVAMLGLVNAVDRFDPELETRFVSFAGRTIDGEIKRFFRDRTWSVRMPRRLQELHLRVRRASEELAHTLGRPPTINELADHVGVETDDVLAALDAGNAYRADSLDRPAPGEEERRSDIASPDADAGFTAIEQRSLVQDLLSGLPERERRILELRFFNEMSQTEIAAELGISQMHVSRLLRRTVDQLRERARE
jgi:RNA polymerase sigma-B factor